MAPKYRCHNCYAILKNDNLIENEIIICSYCSKKTPVKWTLDIEKKAKLYNVKDEGLTDESKAISPDIYNDIKSKDITLTTAQNLEGYQVIKTLEIITAECVFGMNVFRDFFAGLTDFFGGRSEASQKVLKDARKVCLNELKKEALNLGANAVIAVDLDYSEISGSGKSMLFLVASGTAVKVEKKELNNE